MAMALGAVQRRGFDVNDGMSATLSPDWMERAERAYERRGTIEFSLSWSE